MQKANCRGLSSKISSDRQLNNQNFNRYETRQIHCNYRCNVRLLGGSIFKCSYDSRWNNAGSTNSRYISSNGPVGRIFEAKLDQDVAVKGNVLLKAGTKAIGRIKSSRGGMSGRSEPFSVELTSISVNGSNVAIKTNSAEPGRRPGTARQAQHGVTVGKLQISPGTKMQFQLTQAVSF
jgi:hypothetical protein